MSERDVKGVTDVTREVAKLGTRARAIAEGMKRSIGDTNTALDLAESVSESLQRAAAELRGVLGVQTNNPPVDEDGEPLDGESKE